jgi:hypothetical protein
MRNNRCMPFNPERVPQPVAPESWTQEEVIREVFADAMLKTQARFAEWFLTGAMWKNKGKQEDLPFPPENYTFDHGLQLASENECDKGSLALIYYLMENPHFKEQFKHAFLLASYGGFSGEKEWNLHIYAVTQDSHGMWRAASPANHVRSDSPEPREHRSSSAPTHMNRILVDPSLAEVIHAIEELDGGQWPSAEYIDHHILTNPDHQLPSLHPSPDVPDTPLMKVTATIKLNKDGFNDQEEIRTAFSGEFLVDLVTPRRQPSRFQNTILTGR